MLKMLYPDDYVRSVYDINFEELYKQGYRGIIFDIDNTLVFHGAPADGRSLELFDELHKLKFNTVLLSNNKDRRVAPFATAVRSLYICNANKPSKTGYNDAMRLMRTKRRTTLVIGDQLFTDIWGGKRAKIRTVLVEPLGPKEDFHIFFKRVLEKIILFFYDRSDYHRREVPIKVGSRRRLRW
ncbi:MAG: HAD hydrolase-like protein [Lachnospiraceae bacterium]|nr:HAD hydrolase-like protein [Lachnospiraceae bacterium]